MTLNNLNLQNFPRPYLTDWELALLSGGSGNSHYGKVKRLIAEGALLHIRRGLYVLPNTEPLSLHPFELAQAIYGPSYISYESALSYHQLIPERVYTTTSATAKRSKEFTTPLGLFSYSKLPASELLMEVELIKSDSYQFMIAKPWKAICDYIYSYKKDWDSLEPLEKSLRIDLDSLPILESGMVLSLMDYYHSKRVTVFLKKISRELKMSSACSVCGARLQNRRNER